MIMMEVDYWQFMKVLPWVAGSFLFIGIMLLGYHGWEGFGAFQRGCRNTVERLAQKGRNLPWHQKTERWLLKNGVKFHLGTKISPMAYLALRAVLAAVGFLVLGMLSPVYGLLAGIAFYYLPVVLILYMNRSDNIKMLPELKHVYHALEIQTRAGVYVTDSLAELYGSVQEKRLKQALLDLAGDIVIRSDLNWALEEFQRKFDNRYIDSLCMIILQATESGQAVELLGDLSEQIKDMEAAVLHQKKEALDRSVTFYQLGILVAVMGLVLYACVTQMFTAATNF